MRRRRRLSARLGQYEVTNTAFLDPSSFGGMRYPLPAFLTPPRRRLEMRFQFETEKSVTRTFAKGVHASVEYVFRSIFG